MTPWLAVAVVVLVLVLAGFGVFYLRHVERMKAMELEARDNGERLNDEVERIERERAERTVKISVHPTIPPRLMIYEPKEGRPTRSCHCHDRPLEIGEQVYLWTQADESVLLLHEDMVPGAPQ